MTKDCRDIDEQACFARTTTRHTELPNATLSHRRLTQSRLWHFPRSPTDQRPNPAGRKASTRVGAWRVLVLLHVSFSTPRHSPTFLRGRTPVITSPAFNSLKCLSWIQARRSCRSRASICTSAQPPRRSDLGPAFVAVIIVHQHSSLGF